MKTELNPFPDYPVIRLQDKINKIQDLTIPTEAILESRLQVKGHIKNWITQKKYPDQKVSSLIIGVRGDFGSGKTHLLLDASAQFKSKISDFFPKVIIINISCQELNPVEWFKSAIGPELKKAFFEDVIVRLYARAGENIASQAKLTDAAVKKLKENPHLINQLIRENLLSATAVEQEFEILLNEACRDVSEDIRRAITGLVWAETVDISTSWLAGETLNNDELKTIRVSKNLNSENDAKGVLIALASISSYVDIPFCLMIDELEHLTRYDTANDSNRNITWLKRLLEGIGKTSTLVYVAGHWSAWEVRSDYLDRFSLHKPIDLVKLNAPDVLKIVKARVGKASLKFFTKSNAKVIAELSMGNIRRIFSICRYVFKKTDGFKRKINEKEIIKIAEQIGQRLSIEDAILHLHKILEQQELSVKHNDSIVGGIRFNLTGYRGGKPAVIVKLKHVITQADLHGFARHFKDQMKEIYKHFPNVIGCFIADGNIDEELLSILQSERQYKILWFDLAERDIVSKIARNIGDMLKGRVKSDNDSLQMNELLLQNQKMLQQLEEARNAKDFELIDTLKSQQKELYHMIKELQEQMAYTNQEFVKKLSELEEVRTDGLKDLYSRLAETAEKMQSDRHKKIISPTSSETSEKLHSTYTELSKPVTFVNKLGMISQDIFLAVLSFFIGIFFYIGLSEKMMPKSSSIILLLPSIFLLGIGIWRIVQIIIKMVTSNFILNKFIYFRINKTSIAEAFCLIAGGTIIIRFDYITLGFFGADLLTYYFMLRYLITTFFIGYSIWLIIGKLKQINDFFDFRSHALREIYLRDESSHALIKADKIFTDSLNRYGPIIGKWIVKKYLQI